VSSGISRYQYDFCPGRGRSSASAVLRVWKRPRTAYVFGSRLRIDRLIQDIDNAALMLNFASHRRPIISAPLRTDDVPTRKHECHDQQEYDTSLARISVVSRLLLGCRSTIRTRRHAPPRRARSARALSMVMPCSPCRAPCCGQAGSRCQPSSCSTRDSHRISVGATTIGHGAIGARLGAAARAPRSPSTMTITARWGSPCDRGYRRRSSRVAPERFDRGKETEPREQNAYPHERVRRITHASLATPSPCPVSPSARRSPSARPSRTP
jgi:hypothetical protein